MWEVFKELLKQEAILVADIRSKGSKVPRPSAVISMIFWLFYLLSPIDVIPEGFIHPIVFGYIDDLILTIAVGIYVYSDIMGVIFDGVRFGTVQERRELLTKVKVFEGHKDANDSVSVSDTSVSVSNSDDNVQNTGNPVHVHKPVDVYNFFNDLPFESGGENDGEDNS